MTDDRKKDFIQSAFNVEDFQGLGRRKIWRLTSIFFSEFFATAVTVFLLCSAIQGTVFNQKQSHLTVGTTGGFAVATSVMLFGHVSGSYINPALSLAAVILCEISLPLFVFYVIAECSGATFGYALTRALLPEEISNANSTLSYLDYNARCCSVPDSRFTTSQILLGELLATAILTWAFCSALDKRNLNKHDSLPVKFGIVIIALALPIGLYTGCNINPARSFGPAVYNNFWDKHWVYWLGPMLGGFIAATSYRFFFDPAHMEITSPIRERRDSATVINLRNNSHKCDNDA
ncbi:hypothetical protein PGB90_003255 [Kerria lacca]